MSKTEKAVDNDDIWASDEDDSDFVPEGDQEGDHDISDNDQADIDEGLVKDNKKRSLEQDESVTDTKRTKSETERKAKVEALWAEMNATPAPSPSLSKEKHQEKQQPLDEVSSSVNQIDENPLSSSPSPRSSSSSSSSSISHSTPRSTSTANKKRVQRPKSNLSDLVSQYNIKVPKINTLEKSRLDWQGYVEREGIKDDLRFKNKDGYMEKVAFLNRVDDRRWNDLKQGQKLSKK